MTCMAGAGHRDREKLNMVVKAQADEDRAVFCALFWCCLISGIRDGSSGSKLRPAWERREERNMRLGRGCHSSLPGELIGMGYCLPCT